MVFFFWASLCFLELIWQRCLLLWPGGDNLGTLFHLVDRTHDSTGFGVSQSPKWPIVLHSRLAGIAGSG